MDVGVVMEQEGASLIRMVSKFSLDFPLSGQTIVFTIFIICIKKKHWLDRHIIYIILITAVADLNHGSVAGSRCWFGNLLSSGCIAPPFYYILNSYIKVALPHYLKPYDPGTGIAMDEAQASWFGKNSCFIFHFNMTPTSPPGLSQCHLSSFSHVLGSDVRQHHRHPTRWQVADTLQC